MNLSIKNLALAMTCSVGLAACGGGSSDSSSGGSTPVNDLAKAKALVNSAHQMVMDAKTVSDAYKNVGNTWTFAGAGGVNLGLETLVLLVSDAAELEAGTYTGAELNSLLQDASFDAEVTAASGAELKIAANGEVTFKGVLTIKEIVDYDFSADDFTPIYGDPTYLSFENIKLQLPSDTVVTNTNVAKLLAQGMVRVLPTATAAASNSIVSLDLTGAQPHSLTLKFSDSQSLQQRIDAENAGNGDVDEKITEVLVHLDSAKIVTQAPVSTLTLNKLDLTLKSGTVDVIDEDNTLIEKQKTLIPTLFSVKGGFETAQAPATKGNVDFSISLDNTDLSKVYYTQEQFIMWGSNPTDGYVTQTESEDSARFAKLTLNLHLNASFTANSKTVPFDVTVSAKRSQFEQPSYGSAVLKLNGETLTLTDKTTKLANGGQQVVATVTHPNGAFVDVTYINDVLSSAPIKVGSTVHGNIMQSSGAYVAKFTDNTIIGL